MNVLRNIGTWFVHLAQTFRDEMNVIVHDSGVLLFFVVLPLVYPIVYTLIYNTEDVHDIPFAVVDHCRSAESRSLVRMADATPQMQLFGYAADMREARSWMADAEVFGILEIPADYSEKINKLEQATAVFYAEMSLLLRYRAFLSALTEVQLAAGAQITEHRLGSAAGLSAQAFSGSPINVQTNFLGDTQQGFASFIIPGIVVLILQQSMILGICMIAGTESERRRRGRYMLASGRASVSMPSASVLGKVLCYTVFYMPFTIYILHFVPVWFDLPHQGSAVDYLLFMLPFLLSSACFGLMLGFMMREREDAFIYIVFTSLVFLFLSGLTWPRYAMNSFLYAVSCCLPSTWGIDGFVHINSNGATLAGQSGAYTWLWGLTVVYFIAAWILKRRLR